MQNVTSNIATKEKKGARVAIFQLYKSRWWRNTIKTSSTNSIYKIVLLSHQVKLLSTTRILRRFLRVEAYFYVYEHFKIFRACIVKMARNGVSLSFFFFFSNCLTHSTLHAWNKMITFLFEEKQISSFQHVVHFFKKYF